MRRAVLLVLLVMLPGVGAAATPSIDSTALYKPTPWNIAAADFRAGDDIAVRANVTDGDGRDDIEQVYVNVSDPGGIVDSFVDLDAGTQIADGYRYTGIIPLDSGADTGDWDVEVVAVDAAGDEDTLIDPFTVHRFDTVSLATRFNLSGSDAVYVDGEPGIEQTYTDVDFPYIVAEAGRVMAGLINYGSFQSLTYDDQGADQVFTVMQGFADNRFLLPFTTADHHGLDELRGAFTGNLFGRNSFLSREKPNIGHDPASTKTVRLILPYAGTGINLTGFDRRLGPGTYTLTVRNTGVSAGAVQVEVTP